MWNETKGVGSGYYRRLVLPGEKGQWQFCSWKDCAALGYKPPLTRAIAEQHVIDWQNDSSGSHAQYALVQCGTCHNFHNGARFREEPVSDWTGTRCFYCKPPYSNSDIKVGNAMKNGEVRKLPKSSSPMWAEQWACMGTAKVPYIVSRKKINMGHEIEDNWACSCPDWTRHTPRVECKHIVRVQKKEGLLTVAHKPGATSADAAAFEQWKHLQKLKKLGTAGEVEMVGDRTGRKFR